MSSPGESAQRPICALSEWEYCELEPNIDLSEALNTPRSEWLSCKLPTTLGALGVTGNLDKRAFAFRCRFERPTQPHLSELIFEGLAGLCDVQLNGQSILATKNTFRSYRANVTDLLRDRNELVLSFEPMAQILGKRHPRPRWKTRLVDDQNLRWVRTTLLGRMPGWAGGGGPVGPYRSVYLTDPAQSSLDQLSVVAKVSNEDGLLHLQGSLCGIQPTTAKLLVTDPEGKDLGTTDIDIRRPSSDGTFSIDCVRNLGKVSLWWPHTHGTPNLYSYELLLEDQSGTYSKQGKVGFRSVSFDPSSAREFKLNDIPIFCRGSNWTPLDARALAAPRSEYRRVLERVRSGGMNMLRVAGTMLYECSDFYELCDELGIMVWQDFMFANMDYPCDDDDFADEVLAEVEGFLKREGARASVAVLCGGSEVAQQAAMMGVSEEHWLSPLFREKLPSICRSLCPATPYAPGSPWGTPLPFQLDSGIAHYFGVGAYLKPLEDVQLTRPAFSTECLAFSNIPTDESLLSAFSASEAVPHHPRYRAGVPRDNAAGWDFTDVTDHYLEQLFEVRAANLRYHDPATYMELSRLVPGEVMENVYTYLRSATAESSGALTWFLKDLNPGAGWGALDYRGEPKPVYYYLRRVFLPVTIGWINRGLNGLELCLFNDTATSVSGKLQVSCFRDPASEVAQIAEDVSIPPRSTIKRHLEAMVGRFIDPTFSYRFGPPNVRVAHAEFLPDDPGQHKATASAHPVGLAGLATRDVGLEAIATRNEHGFLGYTLTLGCKEYCHAIQVSVPGYSVSDNYVHLIPGSKKTLQLTPQTDPARRMSGFVKAANCPKTARIKEQKQ